MMNELKQRPTQWRERAKRIAPGSLPMQTKADAFLECADELDAIIRKCEEPSEAMLDAGADAIGSRLSMANPESRSLAARACFKAMIEAEDESHE